MTARTAMTEAAAAGVTVTLRGNALILEATNPPPEPVVSALREHKAEILRLLGGVAAPAPLCTEQLQNSLAREWVQAVEALAIASRPDGFTPREWQQLVADAERFLKHWAAAAERAGWGRAGRLRCPPPSAHGSL